MFQYQGVGITWERISELLRLAAVAEGYPAHLIGSHSLRKGGATAMLSCIDDIEQVKRFGGWKSDAVHAYLYSDHAACPDRAKAMLRSAPVLHPPQRHRSQPPRGSKQAPDANITYSSSEEIRCGYLGGNAPCAVAAEMAQAPHPKRLTEAQLRAYLMSVNPYELLGIPETATPTKVEKAYRKQTLRVHPDKLRNESEEVRRRGENAFKDFETKLPGQWSTAF